MLIIHADGENQSSTWQPGSPVPAHTVWLDLCEPDSTEVEACEAIVKLKLPAREDIAGIGVAGRNRCAREALFLQISRFADSDDDRAPAGPIALILTPDMLVTQRYASSETFEIAAREWHDDQSRRGAANALAELIETMAERTADAMQKIAGHVAELSGHLITENRIKTHSLRRWLGHVVKLETALARSRGALLGVTRIVVFICEKQPEWIPAEPKSRIEMVRNDLAALDHFDEQLTGKLQFLLDAIFGFIGVNQNNVMKLLTVVSVVAVPPVILAGIWGMNFKAMPELSQPWGYAMALAAIMVSVLIPLAIFKWRGWLSND
jgi:magnesium transporter